MQGIKFTDMNDSSIYDDIPFPKSWVENPQKIKKTFVSESATETDVVIREAKLVVSVATTCLDDLLATLVKWRNKDMFKLTKYDPATKSSDTCNVRMTDFNYELVEKSADLTATNGVWSVSYNLEEF